MDYKLLYETADNVSSEIESYRFNEAANNAYHFVWHNFCDWYLEIVKPFYLKSILKKIKR